MEVGLGALRAAGKSKFDKDMPSTFWVESPSNVVADNVAAGGERVGFM